MKTKNTTKNKRIAFFATTRSLLTQRATVAKSKSKKSKKAKK